MQLTKHNAKQQNRINKSTKKKNPDSKRFKASAVESVPSTVNYDQFYVSTPLPSIQGKGVSELESTINWGVEL